MDKLPQVHRQTHPARLPRHSGGPESDTRPDEDVASHDPGDDDDDELFWTITT